MCNAKECSYENEFPYTKALLAAVQALTCLIKLHLDFSNFGDYNWDSDERLEQALDGVADSISALPSLR